MPLLKCIIVLSEHGATVPRKKSESLDPRAEERVGDSELVAVRVGPGLGMALLRDGQ